MKESKRDKSIIVKTLQFFLEKFIIPLLLIGLTPMSIVIMSQVTTGNWIIWFVLIPKLYWTIFWAGIVLWFIMIMIVKQARHMKKLNTGPLISIKFNPAFGWINIAKLKYAGVIWRVQVPAPSQWDSFDP
ncbi:MAG TPA: hypothetical protein VMT04_02700, partial [Terriglobales bacterium]|nr:hypothetical protein [Terriglobales bacterium]